MAKKKKSSRAKPAKTKKRPAKAVKAKKPARKATKIKAKAKPAKRPAKKAKAVKKTIAAKKKPAKKTKAAKPKAREVLGEGNYSASRRFRKEQTSFVKRNKAKIASMGETAEAALEGPEGDTLRAAEQEAASHAHLPQEQE
jgi:hypothetical protein